MQSLKKQLSRLFSAEQVFPAVPLIALLALFSPGDAHAAGYKIPEQSGNAVALSSAYVANASGPDAAYYNPANMVWSRPGAAIEGSLNYIRLPKTEFRGTVKGLSASADSKSESFFLPNFHYISPKVGRIRFGLSLVYPFGLTRRWDTPFQKVTVEEFTLKTIELDLSAGYEVSKKIAIGAGIRGIYSDGTIKSDGVAVITPGASNLKRNLEGDDFSAGYYLALAYRPLKNLSFATTYRSEVTPELEGDAQLSASTVGGTPLGTYDGPASLEVVLPATFQLATAYTYHKSVFEFVYERTFWGAYKTLDVNYGNPLGSAVLSGVFDAPKARNYQNADTYRLGLTYHYSPEWTLLFGFGLDETPVPEKTLGFELPDADALFYSTGVRYQPSEKLSLALAYLLSDKESRKVSVNDGGIKGRFKSSVHLLNASVIYRF